VFESGFGSGRGCVSACCWGLMVVVTGTVREGCYGKCVMVDCDCAIRQRVFYVG
jgi:hypothetical protein